MVDKSSEYFSLNVAWPSLTFKASMRAQTILEKTNAAKAVDEAKLDEFSRQLEELFKRYISLKFSEDRTCQAIKGSATNPKNNLSNLSTHLSSLQSAAKKIRGFLNEENYSVIKDALDASSISASYNTCDKLYITLRADLEQLDGLIKNLTDSRATFDSFTQHERERWPFSADSIPEAYVRSRLYAFVKKTTKVQKQSTAQSNLSKRSAEANEQAPVADYFLLQGIAHLYELLFDAKFKVAGRAGKPNYSHGEARFYLQTPMKFACNVIDNLELTHGFLKNSRDNIPSDVQLINRVGRMWEHISS
jgi:hypothetical protein